jgi:LacI family transcriptional regulator
MQGGEAAMVELLGRNLNLSAIFAYNDSMAAGALTALKDNGIQVPQHFSVVGFDDIPISRYTDPQLTTVRYPIVSMAKLATELALQGAAGCIDSSAKHIFMPTLVRRHSVAQKQIVESVTNSGDSTM